jgi:hypothetical protein
MKINEVCADVLAAITEAKAKVGEITGRKPTDINVALELGYGYDAEAQWSVHVFEAGYQSITATGQDLEQVLKDIAAKHAEHLTGVGSSVEQVKRLAEKLGVKVEVLA